MRLLEKGQSYISIFCLHKAISSPAGNKHFTSKINATGSPTPAVNLSRAAVDTNQPLAAPSASHSTTLVISPRHALQLRFA